jgi:hypothetical protein
VIGRHKWISKPARVGILLVKTEDIIPDLEIYGSCDFFALVGTGLLVMLN